MPKPRKAKRPLLSRLPKKPLLVAVMVLALLIAGGLAYSQYRSNQTPATDATDSQSGEYINLDPPTEQDRQETEANKKSITEDSPSPAPTTSDGKKQVKPIITFANRNEVRAYVPGIFEDNGTCTATATNVSQTITKSSVGFKNVSDTQCAPIQWSLPGGNWSVTVSYSSGSSQGKSEAYSID